MSDDKLREIVSRTAAMLKREGNLQGDQFMQMCGDQLRVALADSADAPPEVTEEMVEAAAGVLDEVGGGITISAEQWETVIRKALQAALAAAQPDIPCIQKGCGKSSGHGGRHTDGTLPGHVTAAHEEG